MGKDATKLFNSDEPIPDYKLQAVFQRKLAAENYATRIQFKAMSYCCRKMIPGTSDVAIVARRAQATMNQSPPHLFDRATFNGTVKCHNVWACPVCAAAFLADTADKLTTYLESISSTHSAFMLTFTIPHQRRQPAGFVIETFKQIRHKALHGTVERLQKRIGVEGTVTANEVTYSSWNGWHYHQHVLYILPKENWHLVNDFADTARRYWQAAISALYPERTGRQVKWDCSNRNFRDCVWLSQTSNGKPLNITSGKYLLSYGKELAKVRTGRKRSGDLTQSATLFDLIDGSESDFDRLCEWLSASRNLNRIRFSRGLRARVEKTFAEKKTQSTQDDFETVVVATFLSSDWREICEAETVTGLPLRYEMLVAALDGYNSVWKFCARHNLPLPNPPRPEEYVVYKHRHQTENLTLFDNSVFEAGVEFMG